MPCDGYEDIFAQGLIQTNLVQIALKGTCIRNTSTPIYASKDAPSSKAGEIGYWNNSNIIQV